MVVSRVLTGNVLDRKQDTGGFLPSRWSVREGATDPRRITPVSIL